MFAPIVSFKSWLRRWLQMEHTATMHGQPMTPEQAAADIAERARLGDQIAMAIICEVRDNAKKGDPTAKKAYKLLEAYTARNPHQNLNSFDPNIGEDEACDLATQICGEDYGAAVIEAVPAVISQSPAKAVVTLANGPSLLPQEDGTNLIRTVAEKFEDPELRQAFATGAKHTVEALPLLKSMSHDAQHALFLGYILGQARCIQAVRETDTPLSVLSPMVGWEMGE